MTEKVEGWLRYCLYGKLTPGDEPENAFKKGSRAVEKEQEALKAR